MDPLSQGVLGAAASQTATRTNIVLAGVLGMLAGLAPDLDVFIKSDTDPLLFLDYHRQFSHALSFIPIGGLLCALPLYFTLSRRRLTFAQTYLFCTLGYATHGLLDACTSYGTQLFWPFSNARVAWHSISIIDPLFTLPVLSCLLIAALRQRPLWSRAALLWAVIYLGFGIVQRERSEQVGLEIARSRGHVPSGLEVKPSFGNLLVWKSIYEHQGVYYVDAVRAGLSVSVFPGETIAKLDIARDFPWLDPDSQQARDVERFRWFSAGYLAKSEQYENLIVDMRYSMLPNSADGLWGVEVSPTAEVDAHAGYRLLRTIDPGTRTTFASMIFNGGDTAIGSHVEITRP